MKTLRELAALLPGAELRNADQADSIQIQSIRPLAYDGKDFLSFVTGKGYVQAGGASKAAALLVTAEFASQLSKPLIVVPVVEAALTQALRVFFPERKPDGQISPHAVVHSSAKVGKNTSLGHFVTVGANSVIGNDCIIEDGVKIGEDVVIGDNARIGMNCTFSYGTRIGKNFTVFGNSTFGGDGFGFYFANGIHNKIPQVGNVIIGDNVEIGANCTVDRGALQDTIVKDGCKFDNMVHIAHNCNVGKNVIIAGQSGLAGSTTLGDNVIVGGATAIADHLIVPDGTIVAGGTLIRNSPKEKGVYAGTEGLSFGDFQKMRANIKHLVGFNKWASRIKALEKKAGITAEE